MLQKITWCSHITIQFAYSIVKFKIPVEKKNDTVLKYFFCFILIVLSDNKSHLKFFFA